jgi:hypothetical protein
MVERTTFNTALRLNSTTLKNQFRMLRQVLEAFPTELRVGPKEGAHSSTLTESLEMIKRYSATGFEYHCLLQALFSPKKWLKWMRIDNFRASRLMSLLI